MPFVTTRADGVVQIRLRQPSASMTSPYLTPVSSISLFNGMALATARFLAAFSEQPLMPDLFLIRDLN